MSPRTIQLFVINGLIVAAASAQTWDADKIYDAGPPGSPNTRQYNQADGAFPGWTIDDSAGTNTHVPPSSNPGGIDGLEGAFYQCIAGKQKHRTNNWPALNGDNSTRTALFWRIYIPSSPTITKFPSIQVRTHGYRHHLDFEPDVSDESGLISSGWCSAEGVTIIGGGRLKQDGTRYLPMSMDTWHTVRVEVGPSGQFEAWIDEEEGLSDVRHVTCTASKEGSGDYIEIGVRSSSNSTQYWTNYLAWGQDSSATGGGNAIEPLMSPTLEMEMCDNGVDDDGDGLADCQDPKCDCMIVEENTIDACSNARDDDQDGLYDCEDPDCSYQVHCGEDRPHYVLTLVRQLGHWQNNCAPWCGARVYASVYDEDGTPLDGVMIQDPVRPDSWMVTQKDPGQAFGQSGHARSSPTFIPTGTYQYRVHGDYNGALVSSDVTPPLISSVPPDGTQYSWQMEFMRVAHRSDAPTATPLDPVYIFDAVELNPVGGNNPTLDTDTSTWFEDGGQGFLQTFVPNGDRIVSLRFELILDDPFKQLQYQASIHPVINDPPSSMADLGPQIGATRYGPQFMISAEFWTQMLNWPLEGPDAVAVVPGEKYAVVIQRSDPAGVDYPFFNVYHTSGNYYPSGQALIMPLGGGNFFGEDASDDLTGFIVGVDTGFVPETAPVLVSAASRRFHGFGSASYDVDLPLDGDTGVEPRHNDDGIFFGQLILTFDQPIQADDGMMNCSDLVLTNATCSAATINGDQVVVDLVPNANACVSLQVSGIEGVVGELPMEGDNDVKWIVHSGNVNGDENVNVLDMQAVKLNLFQPVDDTNFRSDINLDNQINVLDMQAVKLNLFQGASSCD